MNSKKPEMLRTKSNKSSKSSITERPQERQNSKDHKENGNLPRQNLSKTEKLFDKLKQLLMTKMLTLEQKLKLRLKRPMLRMRLKVLKLLLLRSSTLSKKTWLLKKETTSSLKKPKNSLPTRNWRPRGRERTVLMLTWKM